MLGTMAGMTLGASVINDAYSTIKSMAQNLKNMPYNTLLIDKKVAPREYQILYAEIQRQSDQLSASHHLKLDASGRMMPISGKFKIDDFMVQFDSEKEQILAYNSSIDSRTIDVEFERIVKSSKITKSNFEDKLYTTVYWTMSGMMVVSSGVILIATTIVCPPGAVVTIPLFMMAFGVSLSIPGKYLIEKRNAIANTFKNIFKSKPKLQDLKTGYSNYIDKYNDPHNFILHRKHTDDCWRFIASQDKLDISKLPLTADMQHVLSDIDIFTRSRADYKRKHIAYFTGFLLHGAKGTGKTSMANIIASKNCAELYHVSLTDSNMTNELLQNLMLTVNPNSVILFDEIDKQIATIKASHEPKVSFDAILSTIGGSIPLPDGVIILMTANSLDFLSSMEYDTLTRPGRISNVYQFTQPYNIIS
jgi:hypothetical protein